MRHSSDTTEEANVLQKLSIEAACPLPAAVTGGSIGRHARRNYGGPGIKRGHRDGRGGPVIGWMANARRGDQSPLWGGSGGEDGRTSGCSGRAVFGLSCSASSASLVQVQAMSVRIERTLRVGARSAICRHSTARCLHSTGVIIDTQPNAHKPSSPPYNNYSRFFHVGRQRGGIISNVELPTRQTNAVVPKVPFQGNRFAARQPEQTVDGNDPATK